MIDEPPTLQAHGLCRSFGDGDAQIRAVDEVSLTLHRGQMYLLMGPSGSGKSTLLAILSGLLHPDTGRVLALGQDLWAMSDTEREEFRRRYCGFIFQGYNLFPALTARQQMEIVLRWGESLSSAKAHERTDKMLDALKLTGKARLRPSQLSGGEKQRVAIGRALIKAPIFCFADEPTSALDWKHGEKVVRLLHDAAHEEGATVMVVSHDPRLLPYADQVFQMEDGRLVDTESAERPFMRSLLHEPTT
jgi:putative ABC transport system ATP-binding protein